MNNKFFFSFFSRLCYYNLAPLRLTTSAFQNFLDEKYPFVDSKMFWLDLNGEFWWLNGSIFSWWAKTIGRGHKRKNEEEAKKIKSFIKNWFLIFPSFFKFFCKKLVKRSENILLKKLLIFKNYKFLLNLCK